MVHGGTPPQVPPPDPGSGASHPPSAGTTKAGERMVLAGSLGYVIALSLPWYRDTRGSTIEATVGWLGPNVQASYVGLLLVMVLVVEVLRGRARRRRPTAPQRARAADLPRRGVVLLWVGLGAVGTVLFRLLAQPEGVYWGLFGGLAATAAIAYGTHLIEYAEPRVTGGPT